MFVPVCVFVRSSYHALIIDYNYFSGEGGIGDNSLKLLLFHGQSRYNNIIMSTNT